MIEQKPRKTPPKKKIDDASFDVMKDDDLGDDDRWMTSTQFVRLLEKQEAVENAELEEQDILKNKRKREKKATSGNNSLATSYLDPEALVPFEQLKKVRITIFIFCILLRSESALRAYLDMAKNLVTNS